MTVFTMPCLKRRWSDWFLLLFLLGQLLGAAQVARADGAQADSVALKVERADGALFLSAQISFDLPAVVEDALLKGIAIYFVAEVDVLKDRWYWTNKKINSLQRHARLWYHPLTKRWRLNISSGDIADSSQGMALNQNFDNLHDALDAVRRMAHWRLAEIADIDPTVRHYIDFRFRLDLTQLPRPLQIGTLGQSEWQIVLTAKQDIGGDPAK